MKTADFDYVLPPALIAQTPIEPRDAARLLVVERATGRLQHRHFRDLVELLRPGDLLVANESRVLPARLWGRKPTGAVIEVLLLRERTAEQWEALVRGKGVVPGKTIVFDAPDGAPLVATVEAELPSGGRLLRWNRPLRPLLPQLGALPLPPYIHAPLSDPERYQTVYSQTPGSAAAPTAGLHFTPALLAALQAQGIGWATVTLHVGLDTFRPVQVEDAATHQMHSEQFELGPAAVAAINAAKREGRRVVAVGTTTVRVLETVARLQPPGAWQPTAGDTSIFIYPPYQFAAVDAMITNFHLPRSTLLMLVSAFADRALIMAAYAEAVRAQYRFFSFGDAMLLV